MQHAFTQLHVYIQGQADLRGKGTPQQNLAYFVCFAKFINTSLKKKKKCMGIL